MRAGEGGEGKRKKEGGRKKGNNKAARGEIYRS